MERVSVVHEERTLGVYPKDLVFLLRGHSPQTENSRAALNVRLGVAQGFVVYLQSIVLV